MHRLLRWLSGKEAARQGGMQVWSLSREGLLEKEIATHSSILPWEIPWSEESGGLQSMGSKRVGRDLGAKSQQHVVYILKSYNWKKAKSEDKSSKVNIDVQSLSCAQLFATPWTPVCQASLSFIISRSLLKHMSIESVMPSNHLILCRPFLLPSIFPSSRVFLQSQLSTSGGQSIGASVSASVLSVNIQSCFPFGLTCLISL